MQNKQTINGIKNRLVVAGKKGMNELKVTAIETIQNEILTEKKLEQANILVIVVQERKNRSEGHKNTFEEVMDEIFPNLMKPINPRSNKLNKS